MPSTGESCDCDCCPRSWDAQLMHARRTRAFGTRRLVRQCRMTPSWHAVAWPDTSTSPVTDDDCTFFTATDGKDTFNTPLSQTSGAYWNPCAAAYAEHDGVLDCKKQSIAGNLGFGNEEFSPEDLAYRIRRVRAYMGNDTSNKSALRNQLSLSIAPGNKVTP